MPHPTRAVAVDEVIAGYEALMHRLADSHAPGVPRDRDHDAPGQAPVPRRAVGRAPHVRPRPAPRRVAVHGERPRRPGRRPRPRDAPRGSRRPPPGPRRPDARAARRSSTASASSTRARCASCSRRSTTTSSSRSGRPSAHLARAAARIVPARRRPGVRPPSPPPSPERTPHEPPLRVRRRQAQRHAAAGRRAVRRRALAWGNLKQELLPDIEFPVITVIAPLPGAGAADVAEQVTKPIERAISGVPAARGAPVDVGQLDLARRRPVRVRHRRQGDARGDRGRTSRRRACRRRVEPTVNALNINASPVIIASIAATEGTELAEAAARRPDGDRARRCCGIEGVASVDLTGGEVEQVLDHARPGQAGRERRVARPGHGRPHGQQPDVPVRPGHRATARRSRSRRSARSTASSRSRTSSSASQAPAVPRRRRRARPPRRPTRRLARPRRLRGAVGRARRARRPDADHHRRPRHGRARRRRDDRLRADQRPAGAVAVRVQDVGRQHGPGRRGGPGQARRARARQHADTVNVDDRLGPVRRSSSSRATACSARAASAPCSRSSRSSCSCSASARRSSPRSASRCRS